MWPSCGRCRPGGLFDAKAVELEQQVFLQFNLSKSDFVRVGPGFLEFARKRELRVVEFLNQACLGAFDTVRRHPDDAGVWAANAINYQLVDVPIRLLEKMAASKALPVGKRKGRQSLGFDVMQGDEVLFHVHFDGADGKCQVRGLRIEHCIMLSEWAQKISE